MLIATAFYCNVCDRENKWRDSLNPNEFVEFEKGADMTDGEDLTFRYNCRDGYGDENTFERLLC